MKKKIILGFLAIVLLLFLAIFSWALDYEGYLKSKQQEWPDQELLNARVIPQSSTPMQSITMIILIPTGQTFPVLIHVKQSSGSNQHKVSNLAKKSVGITTNTAERR